MACNAGGPRAVKYGACRENVLALKAVLGTGELIETGFYTSKYAVGYDLTRLLIGSEGTLAIITEATLKLTPLPQGLLTGAIYFTNARDAALTIKLLLEGRNTPCTLEFVDGVGLHHIRQFNNLAVPKEADALLILEYDVPPEQYLTLKKEISQLLSTQHPLQLDFAENPELAKVLWQVRKALSPALKQIAPDKINEDIVVPVAKLNNFIEFLEGLRKRYSNIYIVAFGHAGNGNLHINLLYDANDIHQKNSAETALNDIFNHVLYLGGTLSGEHGIGLEKKKFMKQIFSETNLNIQKNIKKLFDPDGILNPGKLWE